MNYYIDTEFLEGTQKSLFKSKPTIDLISIGIVAEDGREYYAISKDFNLKEAWNRFEWKSLPNEDSQPIKQYWIRENVLLPVFMDLMKLYAPDSFGYSTMNYRGLKQLIKKFGKTNQQIAQEIKEFVYPKYSNIDGTGKEDYKPEGITALPKKDGYYWVDDKYLNPKFYGYYSDYDWVVFCWLFGKMIDLPTGFPMYCIDLKQTEDEKRMDIQWEDGTIPMSQGSKQICDMHRYPTQELEHNSLSDARFNKELHKFLNTIK